MSVQPEQNVSVDFKIFDMGAYLIFKPIFSHPFNTLRVEVISEYVASFLGGRDSKRSNPSHDICNDTARGEQANQSFVLMMKTRVPVYVGKIEGERTSRLILENIS